ncbi:hypothetical protein Trydic_g8362 [Trypoxylus dichotomus]
MPKCANSSGSYPATYHRCIKKLTGRQPAKQVQQATKSKLSLSQNPKAFPELPTIDIHGTKLLRSQSARKCSQSRDDPKISSN